MLVNALIWPFCAVLGGKDIRKILFTLPEDNSVRQDYVVEHEDHQRPSHETKKCSAGQRSGVEEPDSHRRERCSMICRSCLHRRHCSVACSCK
ncbi:hypothetical protein AN958_12248 [Leucoagaricus sp. SymC.cos]|nr:hypothetical protein AN958_12248 [Leucoagaricus sp. SymC.cos]